MPDRLFTPEEANAVLPVVRRLVERLVDRRAALLAAQARLAELVATVGGNGGGLDPRRPGALAAAVQLAEEELTAALAELTGLGVVVRDLDAGLVDFPSSRGKQPVFLCWQLGEDAVAWWHGREDGFAGRQPIE